MSFVRKIHEEEEERERDGVKVVFLLRISSNEFIYYVDYSRCLSYEKFVRKREREREMELRLSFFLE